MIVLAGDHNALKYGRLSPNAVDDLEHKVGLHSLTSMFSLT